MKSNKLQVIKYIPKGIADAYDRVATRVPGIVSDVASIIREHDARKEYDTKDQSFMLNCLFVPDYLKSLKRAKYVNFDPDLRDDVERIAIKKIPKEIVEAIDSGRRVLSALSVSVHDGTFPFNLTREDISTDGSYTVKPEHKERFLESVTVWLDADEVELHSVLLDAIPKLRVAQAKGFNIDSLMRRYCTWGGNEGLENLPQDIHRYRVLPRVQRVSPANTDNILVEAEKREREEKERERVEATERWNGMTPWEKSIMTEKEHRQNNRKTM